MTYAGTHEPRGLKPQPLLPELSRALEGAVFPLDRSGLIQVARENEAPGTLLTLLAGIPERRYPDLPAVEDAIDRAPVLGSVQTPVDEG